jgi:hypothetical protein
MTGCLKLSLALLNPADSRLSTDLKQEWWGAGIVLADGGLSAAEVSMNRAGNLLKVGIDGSWSLTTAPGPYSWLTISAKGIQPTAITGQLSISERVAVGSTMTAEDFTARVRWAEEHSEVGLSVTAGLDDWSTNLWAEHSLSDVLMVGVNMEVGAFEQAIVIEVGLKWGN